MAQAQPLDGRTITWALPRDSSREGDVMPQWVEHAAHALCKAGAQVEVVPIDASSSDLRIDVGPLASRDLLLAADPVTGVRLADAGVDTFRLWTFLQPAPSAPLMFTGKDEATLRRAVSVSRKVLVFDEATRSVVDSSMWEATANVLVFPAGFEEDIATGFRAEQRGPRALVINLELTGVHGLEALRAHAEQVRDRRHPDPVFLLCGPDLASELRVHPDLRQLAAIPGARVVTPDDESLSAALAGVRPLGFLPVPGRGEDHRTAAGRSWFESRGIELFAEHGALPPLPRYLHTPRWGTETFSADLAVAQERPQQEVAVHDLADELCYLFGPYLPDYATVPQARERTRALLVGADFKFAGDLIEALAQRDDIDLRVDQWRSNGGPESENSAELLEWAEVIICEYASVNAVWYSQHVSAAQRLLVHLHGYELRQPQIHDMDIDAVEAVVFASHFYREEALRVTGWPRERTRVIANPVQSADLARPKTAEARFHLGLAGYVPELKRPDRALDVLEILLTDDPRYTLHLRGHQPWNYYDIWKSPLRRDAYLAFFERLCRDSNLRQAVVFDSFGPDMGNWFRSIGWMLSPSTRETFHLAPVEGMASGAVPVIWRRSGSEEIFPAEWNVSDAGEAAQLIRSANADPGRYGRLGLEASTFATRYDAPTVVGRWMRMVLDDVHPPAGEEQTSALGPYPAEARQEWAEVSSLVAADRHAQAQKLVGPTEHHPWHLNAEQRRLTGQVIGVPALRQRAHHLFGNRTHTPLRALGELTVLVCGLGVSPSAAAGLQAEGRFTVLRLPEAWDDLNMEFDRWVDLIARRALAGSARHIYAVGDELTALASTVAAGRLGLAATWDLGTNAPAAVRVTGAAADPHRASDLALLGLLAARHADELVAAPPVDLNARVPIEDQVQRSLLSRTPVVGLVGDDLTLDSLARPLQAVHLRPCSGQERIQQGVDAVVISDHGARDEAWNQIVGGPTDTVLDRFISEARRYNVPIGLLAEDADLESVIRYARRVDAVIARSGEDVARLHDHRIVPTQVATALPSELPAAADVGAPATSLLERPQSLELLLRMLRLNQPFPS